MWLGHHFQGQYVKCQSHQAALLSAAVTHKAAAAVRVGTYGNFGMEIQMAQDRVSLASDVPPIQRGGTQCSQFFWTTGLCYVVFIAFNINHSGILPLMALNSLYCADVPLGNYSLTHSLGPPACTQTDRARLAKFGTVTLEAVAFFLGVQLHRIQSPCQIEPAIRPIWDIYRLNWV